MTTYGLVAEGGGMKCVYGAGILDRFLEDDITSFDYAVGVSAGSANILSYLGGHLGRTRRFYIDHIHEPGYFGVGSFLKTGNLFGLQYIYGTLTNSDGADPVNFPNVISNPTRFEIVCTDAETGTPRYFDKSTMHQDDYRLIMASCALPAACKPMRLDDGRLYYDGGASDAIPVQHAIDQGIDKLVVITSKPRDFVKGPESARAFYKIMCRKYPQVIAALDRRHIMYAKCQRVMFELEALGRAFIFAPSHLPKVNTYTMDERVEAEIYDIALADYDARRDEFFAFLGRDTSCGAAL